MGKFPFKRPRIISKKFPQVNSSIDAVKSSLDALVFSYEEQVEKTIQRKHVMMAISSIVLLVVLGSFISPKGKANISIFYPETCLGGWVNPHHAQGKPDTSSNSDEAQFTKDNSAILPKNTSAEMYCGNFRGTFDAATKPTKILISLALTKGEGLALQNTISDTSFASSVQTILDTASTTDVSFTLINATTLTSTVSTSTVDAPGNGTTTVGEISGSVEQTSTNTATATVVTEAAATIPVVSASTPPSVVDAVVDSIKSSIDNLFNISLPETPVQTDTVVVPPPVPSETAEQPTVPPETLEQTPTSFNGFNFLFSYFVEKVFAIEVSTSSLDISSSTFVTATTTTTFMEQDSASSTFSTTTQISSTTSISVDDKSTSTISDDSQNNFLEVLYTFDGVTWSSLGMLNEISMKYRTFEIPLGDAMNWDSMAQFQIKVVAMRSLDETPTVYFDAVKAEVMYETAVTHEHPDFARDTILKDEIIDGVRVVAIVNNDTQKEEIWYMQLPDEVATSTLQEEVVSTSTSVSSSSVVSLSQVTVSSSSSNAISVATNSLSIATSQPLSLATATVNETIKSISSKEDLQILPVRKVWKKYEGDIALLSSREDIVLAIKDQEKKEELVQEVESLRVPDFAVDVIKRIKGIFLDKVIVQVERTLVSTSTDGVVTTYHVPELWLYDPSTGKQEKIDDRATSTELITMAGDYPIGVKGVYVFWLSENKDKIYAYNVVTKRMMIKDVPAHSPSLGERGEIHFEEVPWKVIVGSEGFSFYTVETGEVFSDEDSRIAEQLRHKIGLDAVLNKEELSDLNFSVQE